MLVIELVAWLTRTHFPFRSPTVLDAGAAMTLVVSPVYDKLGS